MAVNKYFELFISNCNFVNYIHVCFVFSQISFSKGSLLAPCEESYDKPRQCIKKQTYHFVDKGPYSQTCDFSSSHVKI